MSKYLEFKEIPFKGKTKRFLIISKNSIGMCKICFGNGWYCIDKTESVVDCEYCHGTGRTDEILGKIQWYSEWRQYIFQPSYPTVWNKDCLKTIQDFLQQLMDQRKII